MGAAFMKKTRRQLILDIAAMEKKMQYQRITARAHEQYLVNWVIKYRVIVSLSVLSSLFLSLKNGREKGIPQLIKRLTRFGWLTVLAHVERRLMAR